MAPTTPVQVLANSLPSSLDTGADGAISELLGSLPSIDGTYGALFVGTAFNILLYGLALHQVYQYCRFHPSDTPFIRSIVIIAVLLETLNVVFATHACYYYLVSQRLDALALLHGVWSMATFGLIGSGVMIATQMFFIRRVSIIGLPFKILGAVTMGLILAKFGLTLDLTIEIFMSNSPDPYLYDIGVVSAMFATAIVADALLSGALITVLRRGRATHKGENSLWSSAVIYVVNTGLLIGIFDVATLIVAVSVRNTVWWTTLNQITIKLYLNTLLCVLNSRKLPSTPPMFSPRATYGMHAIARSNRLAAAERFNAPQLPDSTPSVLDIRITKEVEGDAALTGHGKDKETLISGKGLSPPSSTTSFE